VQYKHNANPLLSVNNYTPLLISRNDKNKQLTLLSQHKLALIGKKYVNGSVNLEGNKNKNLARRFLWPISIHICHQKPNTARETVPFSNTFKECEILADF
jgi:hypothetical protein